ncbi:MAG: conjugal transfer protein TraX [Lachnospiraceae bacterium]|nr:conjugal transfer protein TraX [Lachnospiraceae bacterium]
MNGSKKSSFTGFGIKLIALITMAIDHIGAAIVEPLIHNGETLASKTGGMEGLTAYMIENNGLYILDDILRVIGRLAFPLFCFLLCESFQKTKHLARYVRNLFLFGLIAEIPFDLAFNGGNWLYLYSQNVFFTLLIGLLVLCGIRFFSEKEPRHGFLFFDILCGAMLAGAVFALFIYESIIFNAVSGSDFAIKFLIGTGIVGASAYVIRAAFLTPEERFKRCLCMFVTTLGMYLANFMHTDYGATGVLTIVIIYLVTRKAMASLNPAEAANAAVSGNTVDTAGTPELSRVNVRSLALGLIPLTIMNPVEGFAYFDLIFVKKYGGERGRSLKYFFYAFYPVHLFIYYLITVLMGVHRLPWM